MLPCSTSPGSREAELCGSALVPVPVVVAVRAVVAVDTAAALHCPAVAAALHCPAAVLLPYTVLLLLPCTMLLRFSLSFH